MPKGIFPRPVRSVIFVIGPSICYVPLTKGLFSLLEVWDACQVEGKNWNASFCPKGKRFYAYTKPPTSSTVPMHRLLLGFPNSGVDHCNGNSLDNRRLGNLRAANTDQNQANSKVRVDNKTGFKGVLRTNNGRFVAHIRHRGIRIWLGTFDTAEEAFAVYCEAARKLKGEFARFK